MIRLGAALLAAAGAFLLTAIAAPAAAPPDTVAIDGKLVFPESITSTAAGDLIIGSLGTGAVYRAKAGAGHATLWLDPARTGLASVLGVFADEKAGVVYVCSAIPGGTPPDRLPQMLKLASLHVFDLKTGAEKAAYPMPQPDKALCNDIAVDDHGDAFVSDTRNGKVLRLKKGGTALEDWAVDPRFNGVDGIGVWGNGPIYINIVSKGQLFRIDRKPDGSAGTVTEIDAGEPLASPDGLRSTGRDRFLLAENRTGRVSEVTVEGSKAKLRVIKESDPGVTAITLTGGRVWLCNAKLPLRAAPPPDLTFSVYALPLGR